MEVQIDGFPANHTNSRLKTPLLGYFIAIKPHRARVASFIIPPLAALIASNPDPRTCKFDLMTSARRVLLISPQPFFAWRGSSIRVKFNVQALAEHGYQVDLLTIPIGEEAPSTPARVIRVWNLFGAKTISIGPSPLKIWFDLLLFIRGVGLIFANRYDVIHGTEEAGFIAWCLAKLRGAKAIYEKHSDAASYKKGALQNLLLKVYLRIEHFTCRRADLVICTGPGLTEQAKSIAPRALVRDIFDIPSSLIEPSDADVTAARLEMTDKNSVLLVTYVGSFAVYQGVEVVFGAIPKVLSESTSVRFVIIGGSSQEIADRRHTLAQNGIDESSVLFMGMIPPDILPAYLAGSDILMAPRKAGVNTPLKVLDYFKAGGAIVATDTAANRFILDSSCAILSEFSERGFADAILELVNDTDKRQSIAARARSLYEEKFNFTVFSRLLSDAYEAVLR